MFYLFSDHAAAVLTADKELQARDRLKQAQRESIRKEEEATREIKKIEKLLKERKNERQ